MVFTTAGPGNTLLVLYAERIKNGLKNRPVMWLNAVEAVHRCTVCREKETLKVSTDGD